MAARSGPTRIPGLDGLRALAIGLVVCSHLEASFGAAPLPIAVIWHAFGGLGVNLFFGLSGFLITHLLVREIQRTGAVHLPRFYARRVLRIAPAFLFFVAAMMAANAAGWIHISAPDLRSALFLYKNYAPGDARGDGWYLAHIWSLSMEEQFYLIWPWLLAFGGLVAARRAALAVALVMPAVRVAAYFTVYASRPYLIPLMFHTAADKLLWACLLALYSGEPRCEAILDRLKSPRWPMAAGGFYFLLNPLLEFRWGGAYMLPAGISLQAAAVAFMIAWLVRHRDSLGTRCLDLPAMGAVGAISYGLYLWQQPFMKPHAVYWAGRFPLNIACAVGCALISYFLIEMPALRWKARFTV